MRRCAGSVPLLLSLLSPVAVTVDAAARSPPSSPPKYGKANAAGAVASESTICSQIGVDTLRRGGNAADAMVATTLCTGTVAMYHRYGLRARKGARMEGVC